MTRFVAQATGEWFVMSITTILSQLRRLALSLPRPGCEWEERPRFSPPTTPQALAELEHAIGFRLPMDLREFLEHTESIIAMSIHNGYWLGGIRQLIEPRNFPTTVDGEPAIPVATDGGGNAFLLSETGPVWRWNHESGKVELVAASFKAFLEKVAEDWAAYVADKPGWRFLV